MLLKSVVFFSDFYGIKISPCFQLDVYRANTELDTVLSPLSCTAMDVSQCSAVTGIRQGSRGGKGNPTAVLSRMHLFSRGSQCGCRRAGERYDTCARLTLSSSLL